MEFTQNQPTRQQSGSPPPIWSTNQNNHQLVEVSTKKAILQRRPSRRKLEVVLTTSIIILAVLVSILIFVSVYYFKLRSEFNSLCLSPQCIHSASSLLHSMDRSADPCDDFYQYVCGRFHEEHPIPQTSVSTDWFTERSDRAIAAVSEFLQQNDSDWESEAVYQARMMYRACLDTEKLEELRLQPLSDVLEEMGLPLIPAVDETNFSLDVNISGLIALAKNTIGKDLFIHGSVYADVYNRTINKITIAVPESKSALPSHHIWKGARYRTLESKLRKALVGGDTHVLNSWKRYISLVVRYIFKENNVTVSQQEFRNISNTIIKVGFEVQKLLTNKNISTEEIESPRSMKLYELQELTDNAAISSNLTPKIDWEDYLRTLFDVANVTVDFEEQQLAVYGVDYYKSISKVLSNHSDYEIALTMWWEIVYTLTPYCNEELRTMRNIFLTEALGEPAPLPRESYCAVNVWSVMDVALASAAAEGYTDVNKTKKEINDMINYIQSSFTYYVNSADWIDAKTKREILNKAKVIRRNIAYPEWALDAEEIDLYYADLNVTEEDHMQNFLNIVQLSNLNMLKQLPKTNDYSALEFDPREVNALYIPQENSIIIPLGMIQFPFFHTGLDSLNYGSLGTIIGHELTHAFDVTGRKYDKFGNVNQWWTNKTIKEYTDRVSCFINQYNDFWIEEADEYLNGTLTLGENLADNGGLKDAFFGFQKMKEETKYKELHLPGLEDFNSDQLFFLGFANVWCENWTPKSMRWGLTDEHSPNYVRVLATVSNSQKFSEVWNCPKETRMNPETKCQLW